MGSRIQFHSKNVLIEYDDAKSIVEGQKLTLYRWGNTLVTKVEKEGQEVKRVFVKLTPEDKVFKNTTIIHWVATGDNLVYTIK
jgi:hypothetical protein